MVRVRQDGFVPVEAGLKGIHAFHQGGKRHTDEIWQRGVFQVGCIGRAVRAAA
jgi:hypothetical protein